MFFGDSRTALIFAESVYFKTKLSVIPTGIFDFLLICFISSKLLSHEIVNAKTNKIFKKFFKLLQRWYGYRKSNPTFEGNNLTCITFSKYISFCWSSTFITFSSFYCSSFNCWINRCSLSCFFCS